MNPMEHGQIPVLEVEDGPSGLGEVVEEVLEELMPGTDLTAEEINPPKEVEEERESDWEHDGDHRHFIVYMKNRLGGLPRHSGNTTVGCERAISYLKELDKEISKAIQSDKDNVIDEEEAENIRELIHDYVSKLENRHGELTSKRSERYKKKASVKVAQEVVTRIKDGTDIQYYIEVDNGFDLPQMLPVSIAEPTEEQVQKFARGEQSLTKEAQTARIVLFEDPFLHAITRIPINSSVSAGRNIEDVYSNLKKKYAFTPREELSIQNLLVEKGMPIFKDFGRLGEPADPADGKGVEFSTTYYA